MENIWLLFTDRYIKNGLESYLKGLVYKVSSLLSSRASTKLMYIVTA